jgi:ABC-type hemin transport system ATPase subunit
VFEPLTTTSGISTAAASSSSSGVQSGAAAAGSKEEISKTVRIRSAGGELRVRSVSQLSGGEKKRLALALGLGFAELAAARGRLSSNVLVLDEVLISLLDCAMCVCVCGWVCCMCMCICVCVS